ncbi:FecR domain-containing protein [Verrucomicrobiota bacterium]
MKRRLIAVVVGVCLAVVFVGSVCAAPFEPLFRVMEAEGDCTIQTPAAGAFVPAIAGKAYPYGSRVRTGDGSSLLVGFSDGNTCRMLANTHIDLVEDESNRSSKSLNMAVGNIELKLEENYQNNNAVTVVTLCANISCLSGGWYTLDGKDEGELRVVVIACLAGELGVQGPQYEIPVLGEGDWVSISASRDKGFIRVRGLKGEFTLTVRDEEGNPVMIDMEPESVVKILQKRSATDQVLIVTLLHIAGGEVMRAITYSTALDIASQLLPPDETTGTTMPPSDVLPPFSPEDDEDTSTSTTAFGGGGGGGGGGDGGGPGTPVTPTPVGLF